MTLPREISLLMGEILRPCVLKIFARQSQSSSKIIRTSRYRSVATILGHFHILTLLPLVQIKENISLGDPDHPYDEDRIEQAARLGGALDFVNKLPDGFDAYLDRPVSDQYSGLPEGTKTLFGRNVDHGRVRKAGHMGAAESSELSGGQMQRLALYAFPVVLIFPMMAERSTEVRGPS